MHTRLEYDIASYERKGYDFSFLPPRIYDALSEYLTYRENLGYPIKVYDSIARTISSLQQYSEQQQAEILYSTIESGFATIKYPKINNYNGAKQSTSKRTGHDISAIDNAADEVLRQYQMRYTDRGNNE